MSRKLWVLMATAFVDMLGFAMVFPLLPFYAKDIGAQPFLIGVLISSVNKKILTESAGIDMAPETDAKGKIDEKGVKFNRENLVAYRNKPIQIGDYRVTYRDFHQHRLTARTARNSLTHCVGSRLIRAHL